MRDTKQQAMSSAAQCSRTAPAFCQRLAKQAIVVPSISIAEAALEYIWLLDVSASAA